jgi:hypothetical protein
MLLSLPEAYRKLKKYMNFLKTGIKFSVKFCRLHDNQPNNICQSDTKKNFINRNLKLTSTMTLNIMEQVRMTFSIMAFGRKTLNGMAIGTFLKNDTWKDDTW